MKTIDLTIGNYTEQEIALLNEIQPAEYIRKNGTVLDMFFVQTNGFWEVLGFGDKSMICDKAESLGGWYDRKRDGFMMRTQNSALAVAKKLAAKECFFC